MKSRSGKQLGLDIGLEQDLKRPASPPVMRTPVLGMFTRMVPRPMGTSSGSYF